MLKQKELLYPAGLAILVLAAACRETPGPVQQPDVSPAAAAIGYTNRTRSKLLMLGGDGVTDAGRAKRQETAVCSEGLILPIRYVQFQRRGPDDNGRQNIYNFEDDEGHLFEVTGVLEAPLEPYLGDTCLLVPANYLGRFPPVPNDLPSAEIEERETRFDDALLEADRRRQPPNLTPLQPTDVFSKEAVSRIEKEQGRKVKLYWLLHRAGVSQHVAVVEFEPQGENLLASVVFVEPNRLAFFDMPASNKGGDCWRVSDNCLLNFGGMRVPAVLGRPGEQLVFYTFQGEEGLLSILMQVQGDKLAEIRRDSQYMLPR